MSSLEAGAARGAKKRRRAPDAHGAAELGIHTHEATLAQEWPFETDFNDHFETPKRAYRDIKPVARVIARRCGVDTASLRVYDPYFCRGSMVKHMNELGFQSVINLKRDFYKDIESDSVSGSLYLAACSPTAEDFVWSHVVKNQDTRIKMHTATETALPVNRCQRMTSCSRTHPTRASTRRSSSRGCLNSTERLF